jgi:uncharacterized protein (TIGR00106 family)
MSTPTSLPPLPSPSTLETPPKCSADICLLPLGLPTPSVCREISQIQRFLALTGLHYTMHASGTTIDGSWEDVMRTIGQLHSLVHGMGCVRIQSDIRVGTRTDKVQLHEHKVESVKRVLDAAAAGVVGKGSK